MKNDNPEEFYDIAQRNRKYAAVDKQNGPKLLEKVERGKNVQTGSSDAIAASEQVGGKTKASDRFGNVIRGFRRGTESGQGQG